MSWTSLSQTQRSFLEQYLQIDTNRLGTGQAAAVAGASDDPNSNARKANRKSRLAQLRSSVTALLKTVQAAR